jgi:hypothetical protein
MGYGETECFSVCVDFEGTGEKIRFGMKTVTRPILKAQPVTQRKASSVTNIDTALAERGSLRRKQPTQSPTHRRVFGT